MSKLVKSSQNVGFKVKMCPNESNFGYLNWNNVIITDLFVLMVVNDVVDSFGSFHVDVFVLLMQTLTAMNTISITTI